MIYDALDDSIIEEGLEVMQDTAVVILAAGQGKRMYSNTPKVLHRILGKPLVTFPLDLAKAIKCERTILVVGHGREVVKAEVQSRYPKFDIRFAVQKQQRGTGDAVMSALPALRGHRGTVLILSGDVPLLDKATVGRLKRAYDKNGGPIAILSFSPIDPSGYGRVIREGGSPVAIREHRDCSKAERCINEVNAGIYLIDVQYLRKSVKKLTADNDQGELYLTDLIAMAAADGPVASVEVPPEVVSGVNDRADLAVMEAVLRRNRNLRLMRSGVTLRQPETITVEPEVKVARDVEIHPGVHLSGGTTVERGATIGAGSVIVDSEICADAVIKPYSVIEQARVEQGAEVGPMARLRPGAVVGPRAKVGNWVEVKNTVMGEGAKANHLAYLGDGVIGDRVNVGAGTIFCNYDGFLKHKTVLGNDVFIGSDSQLVAPVTVGDGAYVASGSTITQDVPPDDLAISRVKQVNCKGTAKRLKSRLKAQKAALKKRKEKKQ